ncbi:hypothetical protein A33M_1875 [Rhodovulum sp. PH10]|uniref:hypothetical protein n=1 Tax=Rhodovulum sp. PH10 TaxID=1187851 RepID=UPI00027C28BB|nr:hypothetical protein [Rhodovulum sp. PH10]EJW12592.1 hypothetical protein A33M_1875 [Rhodovulum sp. PH10]
MTDLELEKALADIDAIKTQIARGSDFRGYGPTTLALTGFLAVAAAVAQAAWLPDPMAAPEIFLAIWIGAAALGMALAGAETVTRSRRLHSRLADEMIHAAFAQFAPAAIVGAVLPLVLLHAAPDALWLLPGLWQLLFGLGIVSSNRALPRATTLTGGWYILCGLVVLGVSAEARDLSPWTMGVPFGLGQLLFAAILHRALGGAHDDA